MVRALSVGIVSTIRRHGQAGRFKGRVGGCHVLAPQVGDGDLNALPDGFGRLGEVVSAVLGVSDAHHIGPHAVPGGGGLKT